MSFNFPNSPTLGQSYTPAGGYQYVWDGVAWRVLEAPQLFATAQAKNRIINGGMQISQENGTATITTMGAFAADQWQITGTGSITFTGGKTLSSDGPRIQYNATKATLAAGDSIYYQQHIEGNRIADFLWGLSTAKPAVLRFEVYSTSAGTFSAAIRGGASFIAPFTAAASTWTTVVIPVPPATSIGTWPTDTSASAIVTISNAVGSTYVGVNGWQANGPIGSPSATNGIATASTLYLRNVGLYLDPDATGLPPKWQMPDEAEELRACQRYYSSNKNLIVSGAYSAANAFFSNAQLDPPMRANPAVTFANIAYTNMSTLVIQGTPTVDNVICRATSGAAGNGTAFFDIVANARM